MTCYVDTTCAAVLSAYIQCPWTPRPSRTLYVFTTRSDACSPSSTGRRAHANSHRAFEPPAAYPPVTLCCSPRPSTVPTTPPPGLSFPPPSALGITGRHRSFGPHRWESVYTKYVSSSVPVTSERQYSPRLQHHGDVHRRISVSWRRTTPWVNHGETCAHHERTPHERKARVRTMGGSTHTN